MRLVELNRADYQVTFSPELLTIKVFNKIITRDKSKDKIKALKEISFIYHYVDIRSDYMNITNLEERLEVIKKDIGLPDTWKIDKDLELAIEVYKERSKTIISYMYEGAITAASNVTDICKNSKDLIDNSEDPISAAQKIVAIIEKMPKAMANLNAAHIELIREQKITEGRTKGSKEFNLFEDGLEFEIK